MLLISGESKANDHWVDVVGNAAPFAQDCEDFNSFGEDRRYVASRLKAEDVAQPILTSETSETSDTST
jgi:hypothetical protein